MEPVSAEGNVGGGRVQGRETRRDLGAGGRGERGSSTSEGAATDALLKSKHPAAKRLRKEEPGSYAFTLSNILVEDDGSFEASVVGQVPKDDDPSGSYDVVIEGKFNPPAKEETKSSAKLQVRKVRVLPPSADR